MMCFPRYAATIIAVQMASFSLCGCGAEMLGGEPPERPTRSMRSQATDVPRPETQNSDDATSAPKSISLYKSNYHWHWTCAAAPVSRPDASSDNLAIIEGEGTHVIKAPADAVINFSVGGNLCSPGAAGRDIVFVIDVSESMRDQYNMGNDPIVGASCGRLASVKAVMDSLAADTNARFGVVTFDDTVKVNSGALLSASNFSIMYMNTATMCAGGLGTNYTAGLTAADTILNAGRAQAHKEVYFMSDGLPLSIESNGANVATRIKQYGGIATMMLGGSNTVLRDQVASVGKNNKPLYFEVSQAEQMSTALLEAAQLKVEKAEFKFGAASSATLEQRPLNDLSQMTFSYNNITVDRKTYPNGFVVNFNSKDSHGIVSQKAGLIKWEDL